MCEWHRGDTLLKASPLWKPCLLPEAPQVSLKTCFFPQRQLSDISKCWYQVLGVNKDNLFPQQQLKLWRYNGTPPLGSTPRSNQMWLGELEGGDPWVGFSYTGIMKGNVSEKAVLKGGGGVVSLSLRRMVFFIWGSIMGSIMGSIALLILCRFEKSTSWKEPNRRLTMGLVQNNQSIAES